MSVSNNSNSNNSGSAGFRMMSELPSFKKRYIAKKSIMLCLTLTVYCTLFSLKKVSVVYKLFFSPLASQVS